MSTRFDIAHDGSRSCRKQRGGESSRHGSGLVAALAATSIIAAGAMGAPAFAQNAPNATTASGATPGGALPGRAGTASESPVLASEKATLKRMSGTDSVFVVAGYTHEIFTYPVFGRPDPVSPPMVLLAADAFPEISLSGVLFDEHQPMDSRAIIAVTGSRYPGGRMIVKAGDRISQYRIVRIERSRVLIDKMFLGSVGRMVLERDTTTKTDNTPQGPVIDIPIPKKAGESAVAGTLKKSAGINSLPVGFPAPLPPTGPVHSPGIPMSGAASGIMSPASPAQQGRDAVAHP